MDGAKEFSDKAMIVISRSGGEGQDSPMDMNAVIKGTYDTRDTVANGNPQYTYFGCNYTNNSEDYDDFDPGESYLELSNTEEAMIEKVCSEFEDVVVVINANNAMELGWVNDYEQIGAVILAPGTGASGMAALGDILNGTVNPSGRTVDTYVYDLTRTPYYNNIGSFTYNNVTDLQAALTEKDPAYQGVVSFVNYVEGIYVGYKFYETAAEEGLIDYDEHVLYPFGHGLSYTTFSQEMENFQDNGNTISFEIAKEDMASYDSNQIKTENGGYILEAGEYSIYIRSDAHTVLAEETFTVDEDISYGENKRESDNITAVNQFQDYSRGNVTYLSRADGFANYEEATAAPSEDMFVMDDETLGEITAKSVAYYDSTQYDDPDDEMPVTGADHGRTLSEYVGVDYDDESWEELLDQLTVEEMVTSVNLGGFQTVAVESVDKMLVMDSDGTSGLNDWYIGVYGTAYPTEVLIAQTWNKDLARRVGEAEGAEYADCRIFGTYSPAMNTHRSAFCGRNFEYYSEDGVLGGHIAANIVNGLQTEGVYAFIKHFVLNDQETNRCALLLTYTDEQPMREIYLKPFEMSVKNFEGQSLAVMSSFNFIGDIAAGANPNLLNTVLRDEWGFEGMVLSDWNGSYGYQNTDDFVRNGNDAMLGFMQHESNQITNTESATLVKAMRQACKNIFYTVVNSGNYTIPDPNAGKMDNMTKMFIGIDAGVAVVALGAMAVVLIRWNKKRKTAVIVETVEEKK